MKISQKYSHLNGEEYLIEGNANKIRSLFIPSKTYDSVDGKIYKVKWPAASFLQNEFLKEVAPCQYDEKIQLGHGVAEHYFIQKSNDNAAPIFEISRNQYVSYLVNPFFTAASIVWRLIGSNDEISQSNLKSIKLGCVDMRNLYKYLPNTLQFSKQ